LFVEKFEYWGNGGLIVNSKQNWIPAFAGMTGGSRFAAQITVTADGSDTVADTHAFFAMAYLLKTCHTIQLDKNSSYIIDASFELPSQWSIVGGYDGPIGMNQAWDIPVFSKDAGRLAMRNNAAIWPQGSSSIKGVTFVKADLAWPQPNPDNYSGIAVQVNGEDVTINSCTFVGFGTGINSPAWDRLRLSDLNMDCKDFCVRIENSFDICYLQNIHCWPFGTAGQPGNFINRPGKGFYLKTACHGTGLTNCFAIGYKYGFWLESVATVHLSNCMADYDMNVNDGAVGFSVINSSFVRFNSCCAASMDIGFCFKGSSAIVVNADCFQLDSDCVRIDDPNSGTSYVSLSDSFFRNSKNGVIVDKNNSRVHINSCAFQALTGSAVINKLGTPTLVEYNNMNW
jgi:hypothetical protein